MASLKLGVETGSLNNAIESANPAVPVLGGGATVLYWSDCHAGTVVHISPSGKTVVVREDKATRIDKNGMSESQEYAYAPNNKGEGREWIFRMTKRGWRAKGTGVSFGKRQKYHDFSF